MTVAGARTLLTPLTPAHSAVSVLAARAPQQVTTAELRAALHAVTALDDTGQATFAAAVQHSTTLTLADVDALLTVARGVAA